MQNVDMKPYRVVPKQRFHLSAVDPDDNQGLDDRAEVKARVKKNRKRIGKLQKRLFAERRRAVLLIVQAMDAGGKNSTIRRTLTGVNPQGVQVINFKTPTRRELRQDFLWRVHQVAPQKGMITVFNRSHYEDVLIARVRRLVPDNLIKKRYRHINDFEHMLYDHGTYILKVFLHITQDYQLGRFKNRLKNPKKQWKFEPADLEARKDWAAYMQAYEQVLNRCSTACAPWYVIPANDKWFRSMIVGELLVEALKAIGPQYPPPDFDLADYSVEDLE